MVQVPQLHGLIAAARGILQIMDTIYGRSDTPFGVGCNGAPSHNGMGREQSTAAGTSRWGSALLWERRGTADIVDPAYAGCLRELHAS